MDAKVVAIDMLAFIEKNYIRRAAGKTTPVACATGGDATLLQLNEPMAEHAHDDADEFFYVIAGQGAVRLGERVEALGPGVFILIPRGDGACHHACREEAARDPVDARGRRVLALLR